MIELLIGLAVGFAVSLVVRKPKKPTNEACPFCGVREFEHRPECPVSKMSFGKTKLESRNCVSNTHLIDKRYYWDTLIPVGGGGTCIVAKPSSRDEIETVTIPANQLTKNKSGVTIKAWGIYPKGHKSLTLKVGDEVVQSVPTLKINNIGPNLIRIVKPWESTEVLSVVTHDGWAIFGGASLDTAEQALNLHTGEYRKIMPPAKEPLCFCESAPGDCAKHPKFRVGQWVRSKIDRSCLGVVLSEAGGCYEIAITQDEIDRKSSTGWAYADHWEPAIPRAGEWWRRIVCDIHSPSLMDHPHDFRVTEDGQAFLTAEHGCCVPVNFGKGNQ